MRHTLLAIQYNFSIFGKGRHVDHAHSRNEHEWLPIQTYGNVYFAISLIRKCQSKFHNVKLLDMVHSAC